MSENPTPPAGRHAETHDDAHHVDYKRVYYVLLVLLVVSVAGPFLEILWVTLVTAFGIALVKANLVIQNFMHLKWERRLMKWMLSASLLLMFLFVAGVAPDVMNHEGNNWVNVAAKAAVERGIADEHAAAGEHVEEGEHVEGSDPGAAGEPATAVAPVPAGFDARAAYNQTCAMCHGQAGDGAGPAGAAMQPAPADFTDAAFWETRDDARIFEVIKNGAVAVGGSPLMVGWSASYDDEQIQALVEYVGTFRPGGRP